MYNKKNICLKSHPETIPNQQLCHNKCYSDENSQILVLKYYQEIFRKTQCSIVSTDNNESSAHALAGIT